MKLVIEVTAEDIARGKRHSCYQCPVSLALQRSAHLDENKVGICHVTTGTSQLMVTKAGDGHYIAETPKEAAHFMLAFDTGEEPLPFSFVAEFRFIR